ncbi:angiopoietin-related protein 3 [Oryzias melastigma]|uniref:angiopoietin-related protein 3 n=1 Tax=Oryzias melastigma TaxID=30732 RepID=UPI00168D5ED4|nr:angiopoietin-related protein 3 [Oryzias melastigma]
MRQPIRAALWAIKISQCHSAADNRREEEQTARRSTKMEMPQTLILLLTVLVHAGTGFPTDRGSRGKHASWDDVNVVAHGLLQLGQGLKEHVDKTKAQMRDVTGKLKAFNGTVAELERRQQEQGEALKARIQEVEGRDRLLGRLAEEVEVKVGEVKQQTVDITSRMDRLEEVLKEPTLDSNDSDHSGASFIQRLMAAQDKRIDQLVEKIKQQQDKLEKQSLHLQALQSKVAHKRVKSHRRRDEQMVLSEVAQHNRAEADAAALRPGMLRRHARRQAALWTSSQSSSSRTSGSEKNTST